MSFLGKYACASVGVAFMGSHFEPFEKHKVSRGLLSEGSGAKRHNLVDGYDACRFVARLHEGI